LYNIFNYNSHEKGATDIAGGSLFEYKMLWVLLLSNVIAIVLQSLAAKLGLATGKDLSQQCTNYYPRWISVQLWILAELAIAATDLAEVLGTAIGLNLLFGLPLLWGVILTAADTLLFLVFQQLGHRFMEFVIFLLMAIISVCFIIEMFYSKPSIIGIIDGFIPRLPPGSLPIATGILGATIMPHNIYLHSGLVLTRKSHSFTRTKRYINFAIIDSVLSLNVALFVNAAIIIVSAAAFYDKSTKPEIIQDAYKMLRKIFG
jgi:manganese transport protein